VQAASYDSASGTWALASSTATSPVQLNTIDETGIHQQTDEAVAGVTAGALSPGEDASYLSYGGTLG
jgi:hypothetical protein